MLFMLHMFRSNTDIISGNDHDIGLFALYLRHGFFIAVYKEFNAVSHPDQCGVFITFRYNKAPLCHRGRVSMANLIANISDMIISKQNILQCFKTVTGGKAGDQ